MAVLEKGRLLQSEDVFHCITSRLLSQEPDGGTPCTIGKYNPVRGAVGKFDTLSVTKKENGMLADDIPTPHRGDADGAGRPAVGHAGAVEKYRIGFPGATCA